MKKVAAIQLNSGLIVEKNLEKSRQFIAEAANQGAELIALPENFALLAKEEESKLTVVEPLGNGSLQTFLSEQAKEHKVYLIGGTIPIISPEPKKAFACSMVFDPNGNCIATYNKIHLFDVQVNEKQKYIESNSVLPGSEVQVLKTDLGNIGLSVCYDVRFPELYRSMLQENVEILSVPAAFTQTTGEVHWEILLRARAIENLSYVIAPNQAGRHECGRASYGHSMIISPWGEILAECKTEEGVIMAELDLEYLHRLRKEFPSPSHRRL